MNQQHSDMIKSKLEKITFQKANAKALAPWVLITVAKELNTDVLEFFEESHLNLQQMSIRQIHVTKAYKAAPR